MGVKIENELIIMALWLGQVEFNNVKRLCVSAVIELLTLI